MTVTTIMTRFRLCLFLAAVLLLAPVSWLFLRDSPHEGRGAGRQPAMAGAPAGPSAKGPEQELGGPYPEGLLDEEWLSQRHAEVTISKASSMADAYQRTVQWNGRIFPLGETLDGFDVFLKMGDEALILGGHDGRRQWRGVVARLSMKGDKPSVSNLATADIGGSAPSPAFILLRGAPEIRTIGILLPDIELPADREISGYNPDYACDVSIGEYPAQKNFGRRILERFPPEPIDDRYVVIPFAKRFSLPGRGLVDFQVPASGRILWFKLGPGTPTSVSEKSLKLYEQILKELGPQVQPEGAGG